MQTRAQLSRNGVAMRRKGLILLMNRSTRSRSSVGLTLRAASNVRRCGWLGAKLAVASPTKAERVTARQIF